MIKLLAALFVAILSLLPDSPFQSYLADASVTLNFLPYLNWFVPFDNALDITRVWVLGVIAYYHYDLIMDTLKRLFVNKLV